MARKASPTAPQKTAPVWLSLSDWSQKAQSGDLPHDAAIRATFDTEIKMPPEEMPEGMPPAGDMPMRRMSFVISTSTPDRDRDVVMPQGVKLDAFMRNPVVLFCHDYHSMPIGRALSITKEADRLVAVAEFATADINPMAESVYRALKAGFLKATSIGFRPVKYSMNEDRRGYDIEECELLEFSIVPVPANAEALALAASASGEPIDLTPIKTWLAQVEGVQVSSVVLPFDVKVHADELIAAVAKFDAVAERLEKAVTAAYAAPAHASSDDDIRITLALEDDDVVLTLADDIPSEPTFAIDRALVREAIAEALRTHVMVPIGDMVQRSLNEARGRVS